jgi:hypothetical protein
MAMTPADTPPQAPAQMPAAPNSGPAAVPHAGEGAAPYDIQAPLSGIPPGIGAAAGVLVGVTGANHVTESPLAAPNVNPYEAGAPQPVYAGGDADAGGRDDVAAAVAGAVANAEARFREHQTDTYGQGSQIGDYLTLPEVPSFHSKHTGGDDAGYPALEAHDDHTG